METARPQSECGRGGGGIGNDGQPVCIWQWQGKVTSLSVLAWYCAGGSVQCHAESATPPTGLHLPKPLPKDLDKLFSASFDFKMLRNSCGD
ncbi:hypothetical protein E2C01_026153 [Portunus trituberculatus]|uniref:Uncharacterized protein n=1 Tax=Portunus trituberculatus TaxID=210409 RepID=A0A5B7EFA6_PORTR|nr:hypothetical protein [Portunus trituberculatus]